MVEKICGYHNKPICKECNACEDCGIDACVHTERGRITRDVFTEAKEFCNNDWSNDLTNHCKLEIEKRLNVELKKTIRELEEERDSLKK